LGNKLFSELQKVGGIAASIQGELAELFEKNFELGMREFHRQQAADSTQFLREMSSYFVQFSPGPENYYVQLIKGISKGGRSIVLATTNYDLLIDYAICLAGWKIAYCKRPVERGNLPLLKIHGSINFLPDLGPGVVFRDVSFSVGETGSNLSTPVRIAQSRKEIEQFCLHESSLAPAVAMYAKGKQLLFCPRFIREQQSAFEIEAGLARRIYVIGLAVNREDAHIWNVLQRAKATLFYVGKDFEAFEGWRRGVNRKQAFTLAETFEEALPEISKRLN